MNIEAFVLELSKKIDAMANESSEIRGDVKVLLSEVRTLSSNNSNNESRIYRIEQTYITKEDIKEIKQALDEIRVNTNNNKTEVAINTTRILTICSIASVIGGSLVSYLLR